jgi:hypothetical protein
MMGKNTRKVSNRRTAIGNPRYVAAGALRAIARLAGAVRGRASAEACAAVTCIPSAAQSATIPKIRIF